MWRILSWHDPMNQSWINLGWVFIIHKKKKWTGGSKCTFYRKRECLGTEPIPSPRSSPLTYPHRSIGYRSPTWHIMSKLTKLMSLSVSDRRELPQTHPCLRVRRSPHSFLQQSHRYIGYRNPSCLITLVIPAFFRSFLTHPHSHIGSLNPTCQWYYT